MPKNELRWEKGVPQTEEEFRPFVKYIEGYAVRYCYRQLGSFEDAEEVAQDGLVKFFKYRKNINKDDSVISYLFKILYSCCCDFRRKNRYRRHEVKLSQELVDDTRSVDYETERKRYDAKLQRVEIMFATAKLKLEQAEVIRCCVWDELSFEDIARKMDSPIGTAKSRYHQGISKLKRYYPMEEEWLR